MTMKKKIKRQRQLQLNRKKTKTHLSHLSPCQQPRGESERGKNTFTDSWRQR